MTGITATSAGITDVATRTVSIKAAPYSARGDGRLVIDAGITSGQATLTSASASFTGADNGKSILVTGAGAAGADLVTTISSVSAGVATLAATAGSTVTNARAVYGTDDTAAILAALDDVIGNRTGGRIVFPDGIYLAGGALVTTRDATTYHAQLPLKPVAQTEEAVYVELCGARRSGFFPGWTPSGSRVALGTKGVVIQSLFTGGSVFGDGCGPALFSAGWTPTSGVPLATNNVNFVAKGITFRAPRDPSLTMVDMACAMNATVDDCTFDTLGGIDAPPLPTHPTGRALVMPGVNNDESVNATRVGICGYYGGFCPNEHCRWDQVLVNNCIVGVMLTPTSHGGHGGLTTVQWCPYALSGYSLSTGAAAITAFTTHFCSMDFDVLWIEDARTAAVGWPFAAWGDPVYHLNDSTSLLRGRIKERRVKWGLGAEIDTTTWLQNGGVHAHVEHVIEPEPIHTIGDAGNPAFQNSWGSDAFTDGARGRNSVPSYLKDSNDVLYLSGSLNGGTSGTVAFTLPVGWRPDRLRQVGCIAQTGSYAPIACNLVVGEDGTVTPFFATAGAKPCLDGISIPLRGNRWWIGE